MEFYTMERFETVGDWLDEVRAEDAKAWEDYEADMWTHPFDESNTMYAI